MADLSKIAKLKKCKLFMLWDIPLFVVMTVVVTVLLVVAFTRPKGDIVAVYVSGKLVAQYALDMDLETEVTSEDGQFTLILRINNGKVSVLDSTCPDHLCEQMQPINLVHQQIVCMPAKIVLKIEGQSLVDGVI